MNEFSRKEPAMRWMVLVVILAATSTYAAEDWPKWLGPQGNGISRETGLAEQWPSSGPKKVWSKKVGIGHSSPVAVDGRVYLFHLAGNQDHLTCIDADSGSVVWDQTYNGGWTGAYKGTRATPTIEKDDNRIYTLGGAGQLVCRELDSGKPFWALDVLKETRSQPLQWGQATSPLIISDRIFVQAGDGGPVCVCVDKKTGHVLWQSQARDKPGYATIIAIDPGDRPQLVVVGGRTVYGVDPKDGKTLWQQPWVTQYDVNAATPVYRDGHLFVSSEYGHGCMMLQVNGRGARKLWEKKDIQCKIQPPILDGDHLYANSSGTLKCMSWPDGKIVWEAKDRKLDLGPGGSMVRVGDRLITLSERGKLSLVHATPEGVKRIDQHQLFDEREVWSTPLVYNGRLYAKGGEEFVCLDLTGR
jgi:outer membrane protein assembly factor BamB